MRLIRAAAGVLNQTPLDWEANLSNILAAIEAARDAGATLLCLPELCISGYGCEDAFLSAGTQKASQEILLEVAPRTSGMIVSLGLPLMVRGALYNTCCLVCDGALLGFVGKQHLAGEGLHYEPRWFKRWPANARAQVDIEGHSYPLGDLVFECGGVAIGFEICEDAWVANRPGAELAKRGVDVLFNPSASHFAFGKQKVRKRFVLEGSRAFHVGYIYANLMGNEAGRAIYDGGALIAAGGRMLAEGPRFSFEDCHVTVADIDVEGTRLARSRIVSYEPQFVGNEQNRLSAEFSFPTVVPQAAGPLETDWEQSITIKEEEFARALALALFDYLRKSRSRGFVVSLSGGADSSAVAVLCALSVQLAVAELGRQRVVSKLSHIPSIDQAKHTIDLVHHLLTCVYQSTRNSSVVTRDAAEGVARSLGAEYFEFSVDGLVQDYVAMVSAAVGRELTWERDDLALQNIQARVRAPGVWLLANLRGALLLATSNRSEAAVGYATMDGDTCGGLSPIAGIDKAFLRHWLHWMEATGPRPAGPLPALAAVNAQQPTAELRPEEANQTDEDDLMPYDLLDEIERAAIRDKLTPLEVFQTLTPRHPQLTGERLADSIERFFQLWSRNQWKRERYAPSFHVDDENLDPKTWCRFPILSGGFERELRQLRESVCGANQT